MEPGRKPAKEASWGEWHRSAWQPRPRWPGPEGECERGIVCDGMVFESPGLGLIQAGGQES